MRLFTAGDKVRMKMQSSHGTPERASAQTNEIDSCRQNSARVITSIPCHAMLSCPIDVIHQAANHLAQSVVNCQLGLSRARERIPNQGFTMEWVRIGLRERVGSRRSGCGCSH